MIALLLSAVLFASQDVPLPPTPDQPTPAVVVQAPGVSVQVAPVLIPRTVLVPRTVLEPQTVLVPAKPAVTRRLYWTPIRDFLFGRHRVHYVPTQ